MLSIYNELEEIEKSSDIYTFVALMTVIYSSFINYPIVSFKIIINSQNLDNLVKYSQLYNQIKFHNTYLTKVNIFNLVYYYRIMLDT
jgi:hypothetical protein